MKFACIFSFLMCFGQLYTVEKMNISLPKIYVDQWHNKRCTYCGCNFTRGDAFVSHLSRYHKIEVGLRASKECPVEGCRFKPMFAQCYYDIKQSIERHIENNHKDFNSANYINLRTREQNIDIVSIICLKNSNLLKNSNS